MNQPLRILSLGAGVQSTALLLMSIRGELPKLDHVIFADTQWEPASVYDHLAWLEAEATADGIPCHRVTAGDLRAAATDVRTSKKSGNTYIRKGLPLFLVAPDGKKGLGTRQCTLDFKIVPINRFCRSLKHDIEMWMGITSDERSRVKDSMNRWKVHCYPFCRQFSRNSITGEPSKECGYLAKNWSRFDCLDWLDRNYPERKIPRSACVSCPYHSDKEWRRLRDDEPIEFARAIADEKALQESYGMATAMRGKPYLHRSCLPLDQVPIDVVSDQLDFQFGMQNECEGMCGV